MRSAEHALTPVTEPPTPAARGPRPTRAGRATDAIGHDIAVDDAVCIVGRPGALLAVVEHVARRDGERLVVRRADGRKSVVAAGDVVVLRPLRTSDVRSER
jgi:hypothetical protein